MKTIENGRGRHYVISETEIYPSITTILGHKPKPELDAWRERIGEEEADKITFQATEKGTALHDLLEDYLRNGEIEWSSVLPHIKASFRKMKPVLDSHLTDIYGLETALFSRYLKTAGRVDVVGVFLGQPSIIDFKTARKIKKKDWITDYFLQATAYSIMYEERTGVCASQLVILMDVEGEKPRLFLERRQNFVDTLKQRIRDYYQDVDKGQLDCLFEKKWNGNIDTLQHPDRGA